MRGYNTLMSIAPAILAQAAAAVRFRGSRTDPESYAREPGYIGIAINGPRGMGPHRGECEALVMDWAGDKLSKDTDNWRPNLPLIRLGPDGKVTFANNIPENSPIATFNSQHHFGGQIAGQAHASIFRYFLKRDTEGHLVRWQYGVDRPDQIVGARVVEQLPDGYRSFRGSTHPQVVNMMLDGVYPHKLTTDYATITDPKAPAAVAAAATRSPGRTL